MIAIQWFQRFHNTNYDLRSDLHLYVYSLTMGGNGKPINPLVGLTNDTYKTLHITEPINNTGDQDLVKNQTYKKANLYATNFFDS